MRGSCEIVLVVTLYTSSLSAVNLCFILIIFGNKETVAPTWYGGVKINCVNTWTVIEQLLADRER